MKNQTNPVAVGLSKLLADTYVLYIKTQNFHWNVRGANFYSYHKMFEEQYKLLAEAIDVLAERIRALQALSPASLTEFAKLTSLQEAPHDLSEKDMIQLLLADHQQIANTIQQLFVTAKNNDDEVTLDLLIQRKAEHDQIAWMLRSTLGLV